MAFYSCDLTKCLNVVLYTKPAENLDIFGRNRGGSLKEVPFVLDTCN